jgi:hypothetical protein
MRGNGGGNGGQRQNSGSNYQQHGDGRPYNPSHNDGSQGYFDQAYNADQSHNNVDRDALPEHLQQYGRQGANTQHMDHHPSNRSPSDVDTQSGDNSDH